MGASDNVHLDITDTANNFALICDMNAVSGLYQHSQLQPASLNSSGPIVAHCASPTDSSNSGTSNGLTGKYQPQQQHHQQQQQQQHHQHHSHHQHHHHHEQQQHLNGNNNSSNNNNSNNSNSHSVSLTTGGSAGTLYHPQAAGANGNGLIANFASTYTGQHHQSAANGPQLIQTHNSHHVHQATNAVNQHQHHHHHHQQQHQQQQYGGHHTIDSTTLGSTHGQNKKSVDKGSDEYKKRRERNNVAVRKSREKAKLRSRETERRVAELSKENQLYRAQYEELRREFNVLKSLLLKTGLTEQVIEDEAQRHTMQQQISQVSNSVHNHMVAAGNHHIVSLNNHVAIKGVNCNSVSSAAVQPHYTNATVDTVDQWTDGINAYVEEWAS